MVERRTVMSEFTAQCGCKIHESGRETDTEAKLRLARCEIDDLKYQLETLRKGTAKRPWRWVKKFQLGGGNHWCLESLPEPDNGVGDGAERTVGIVLTDDWSPHPTPLMLFVQNELNAAPVLRDQVRKLRDALRELHDQAQPCEGAEVSPHSMVQAEDALEETEPKP
jgi:hypothetical protein